MSELKSIKISGTGESMTWSITDAKTGEPINYVRRVEFVGDADGPTEAVLYISFADVDVEIPTTIATEQRAQEERIVQAVLATLKTREDRYANVLERVNARQIAEIVTEILEQKLPELLTCAVAKALTPRLLT